MCRPRYDHALSQFLGFYETLGFIVAGGDPKEHFLDYGYNKQNSKILYSYHKRWIPSTFIGTFFDRHRLQYESGGLPTTYLSVYYFLPSTTDRGKEINRHLGSVNLLPIDISENS